MAASELQLAIDLPAVRHGNLRYDISRCKLSGLDQEKILGRIRRIEAGIEELMTQVCANE